MRGSSAATKAAGQRRNHRLQPPDEEAIVAAYLGDTTVDAICETHHLGLVRLYRVLDRHRIPRRRPNAPRIDRRRVKLILADYATDLTVDQVAAKHGVSTSTVSRLAQRAWHLACAVPRARRTGRLGGALVPR